MYCNCQNVLYICIVICTSPIRYYPNNRLRVYKEQYQQGYVQSKTKLVLFFLCLYDTPFITSFGELNIETSLYWQK